MLGMHISASLSLIKVMVVYSQLAGKDISNNDLFFTFDEGSHGKLDEWQGSNAFLLIRKPGRGVLVSEDESADFLSLRLREHAVLEEGLSIHLLFTFLYGIFIKTRKLAVWIFVDPAALHKVLGELNKSHNVLGSDFLWRSPHLVHLSENHGLGEHDIEI